MTQWSDPASVTRGKSGVTQIATPHSWCLRVFTICDASEAVESVAKPSRLNTQHTDLILQLTRQAAESQHAFSVGQVDPAGVVKREDRDKGEGFCSQGPGCSRVACTRTKGASEVQISRSPEERKRK
eukprot:g57041.t1